VRFQLKATILLRVSSWPVPVLNDDLCLDALASPPSTSGLLSIIDDTMWGFEVNDMSNAWHINTSSKCSRSHNIWRLALDPSLEAGFPLSKEVYIAILGVPMVIMAIKLLG